jgi:hypothetical protein
VGSDWDIKFLVLGAVALVFVIGAFQRRPSQQCPRCREVNREPAIFCAQCGERLPGR